MFRLQILVALDACENPAFLEKGNGRFSLVEVFSGGRQQPRNQRTPHRTLCFRQWVHEGDGRSRRQGPALQTGVDLRIDEGVGDGLGQSTGNGCPPASIDKLLHPAAFAEVIHHYRIVPISLLHYCAHLLPVVEGTTVNTRYGPVKTDHVLFIAAGAFHVARPADLIPELQGRFPIRVELDALTADDFRRILVEPQNSLIRQYTELLATEDLELTFTEDAVTALAQMAADINNSAENIGARRLYTVLERLLDEVSFDAPDRAGERYEVTAEMVTGVLGPLAKDRDLARYIL